MTNAALAFSALLVIAAIAMMVWAGTSAIADSEPDRQDSKSTDPQP